MNNNNNKETKIIIALVVIIIIAAGLVYFMLNSGTTVVVAPGTQVSPTPTVVENTTTTIGTYSCLPHRDTSGPTTMECAFGLQAENGDYYALDLMAVTMPAGSINTRDKVKVTGVVDVKELKKSNIWKIYNIVGGIKVVSIDKMLAM